MRSVKLSGFFVRPNIIPHPGGGGLVVHEKQSQYILFYELFLNILSWLYYIVYFLRLLYYWVTGLRFDSVAIVQFLYLELPVSNTTDSAQNFQRIIVHRIDMSFLRKQHTEYANPTMMKPSPSFCNFISDVCSK